jgi:hypothetical protein
MVLDRHAKASLPERFYAVLSTQSCNAVLSTCDALALQDVPRLQGTVSFPRLAVQCPQVLQQVLICFGSGAFRPAKPFVVAAA